MSNEHSDLIDLQAAEQEEREQEDYAMLCETHRDKWGLSGKQVTPKMAKEPSGKVEGQSDQVRDVRERNVFNGGTFKKAALYQDRS